MNEGQSHPFGFVIGNGQLAGALKIGMAVEGEIQKSFEMREATVEDLLDAEVESSVATPLNFNAQLMIRQLVRVGDFTGPFTINMIKRLKPADFRILRAAQMELDALGEGEPASSAAS